MVAAVVPAALQVGDAPAAAVLHAVRVGAPITRDRLVAETGLSPATINRQVSGLTASGLIVERRDLVPPGSIGRPTFPLTLDRDALCVAGMHIGARRTLLAIADLGGRTLYSHSVLTPDGDQDEALDVLCAQLHDLAAKFSGRRLLWAGVAVGGTVVPETGVVEHPILRWRRAPLGERLAQRLGVSVSVCEHVQAMAAAELLLAYPRNSDGTGLFFYARETVGMAVTIDGRVHVPARGAGLITQVPVQAPVIAGGTAPLQEVVRTDAAARAAQRLGVAPTASVIADERAAILGRVTALFRDALNPDHVVVAGDAFAAHTHGLAPVQAAFDAASATDRPLELVPSQFGLRVQEAAAIVVALSVIYVDPTIVT